VGEEPRSTSPGQTAARWAISALPLRALQLNANPTAPSQRGIIRAPVLTQRSRSDPNLHFSPWWYRHSNLPSPPLAPPGWGRLNFGVRDLKAASLLASHHPKGSPVARYEILRPDPEYLTCECASVKALLIVYDLSSSPIYCSECRRIVEAEDLNLAPEIVDATYRWQAAFGALYNLWLDSGEYEQWAKDRLLDPLGQVNVDGIQLAKDLSKYLPTRYWWFHDTDDPLPPTCPSCNATFQPAGKYGNFQCSECPVLI
jgi:hypothetical protein